MKRQIGTKFAAEAENLKVRQRGIGKNFLALNLVALYSGFPLVALLPCCLVALVFYFLSSLRNWLLLFKPHTSAAA
jgi:hypothetical protein